MEMLQIGTRVSIRLMYAKEQWHLSTFPQSGSCICTTSEGGVICIWDTTTGILLNRLQKYDEVALALFSPDDVHVISGHHDGRLCVWDSLTGSLLWSDDHVTPGFIFASMAISSDGLLISFSISNTISLWQLKTGELIGNFDGQTKSIHGMAFLPNNHHLIWATIEGKIIIWDTIHHCMHRLVDVGSEISAFALSPDGTHFAWAKYTSIMVQELNTFDLLCTLRGHNLKYTTNMSFSPDNTTLASTSDDCTLRLWDISTSAYSQWSALTTVKDVNSLSQDYKVLLTRNGDWVVLGCRDGYSKWIRIWDLASSSPFIEINEDNTIVDFAVSMDGSRIIVAVAGQPEMGCILRKVCIWDAGNNERLFEEITIELDKSSWNYGEIEISHDSSLFASNHVPEGGEIWIWKTETMRKVSKLPGSAVSFAFSYDTTRLVSMTFDCTVCLWDIQAGTLIRSTSPEELYEGHIVFSPDDNFLFCMQPEICRVLDANTLEEEEMFDENGILLHFEVVIERKSSIVVPRLLKIEGEWLWEVDRDWQERLCWLPPEYQLHSDSHFSWQGSHLAIALMDGSFAVLDINMLRNRAAGIQPA